VERAREEEKGHLKRKFQVLRAQQQDRHQRVRSFGFPPKGPNFNKPTGSAPSRFNQPGQSPLHTPYVASSQPPTNACWHYGDPSHYKNNCPQLKTCVPAYSNSVNGPKNVSAPASKAPSTNSQLSKTQFHGRARVNHVGAQEAQQAPGVVPGEFLLEFTPPLYFLILEHLILSSQLVLWKSMASPLHL
jgi:hypothetical protein